jgi:hypothetical protein
MARKTRQNRLTAMFPKLVDGKILIPVRAEGPHGMVGDAWVELSPDDPHYQKIREWIERQ